MHGVRATFDFLHLGGVLAFLPFLQHPDALDATDAWRDACREPSRCWRAANRRSRLSTLFRVCNVAATSILSFVSFLLSRRYSSKSETSSFPYASGMQNCFELLMERYVSFLRRSQPPFIRRCQTSLPENSRGFIAGEEKCERESHELLPPSVGPAKLGQSSRPLINRIRGFPFERTSIESDRRRSSAATPFLPRPLSNSRGAADLFRGRA